MFTTVIDRLSSLLGEQLVGRAIVPAVLWVTSSGLLVWFGADRPIAQLGDVWTEASGTTQALLTLSLAGVVVVAALLLHATAHDLLRAFEGQWGPARWLADFGRSYHKWRRGERVSKELQGYTYPVDQHVQPTLIGNILRSAEDYPHHRYGLDAVVAWPRLYRVLHADVRADLATVRRHLELPISLATVAFLLVPEALILLPLLGSSDLRLLLTAVFLGLAVAGASYAAAVGVAHAYAELVKTTFDLYRQELAAALGESLPTRDSDERKYWSDRVALWRAGVPVPPTEP